MDITPLSIRTDFSISVEVNDRIFRPVIHRYLDLLVDSLKTVLRSVDFGTVCNSSPQVYIQNHPLCLKQNISVTGSHRVQVAGAETILGLGELAGPWRASRAQAILANDQLMNPPYVSSHAETYYANSE